MQDGGLEIGARLISEERVAYGMKRQEQL